MLRQHPRLAAVFYCCGYSSDQTRSDWTFASPPGRFASTRHPTHRPVWLVRRDASDSESDVDFLIEFAPDEKSFDNFMAASFLLEEELGRSVELVTRRGIEPPSRSSHLGRRRRCRDRRLSVFVTSETKRAIWKRPARRSAGKSSPRTRR